MSIVARPRSASTATPPASATSYRGIQLGVEEPAKALLQPRARLMRAWDDIKSAYFDYQKAIELSPDWTRAETGTCPLPRGAEGLARAFHGPHVRGNEGVSHARAHRSSRPWAWRARRGPGLSRPGRCSRTPAGSPRPRAARSRDITITNDLSTLQSRVQSDQALSDIAGLRATAAVPVIPLGRYTPPPKIDTRKLASIPDATLAQSNDRRSARRPTTGASVPISEVRQRLRMALANFKSSTLEAVREFGRLSPTLWRPKPLKHLALLLDGGGLGGGVAAELTQDQRSAPTLAFASPPYPHHHPGLLHRGGRRR